MPRPGLVLACSLFGAAACGEGDAPANEVPEYAVGRSVYATDASQAVSTSIRLEDVTQEWAVAFRHATGAFGEKWMPETMGSGVAIFDYDGDGWPDLYFVNSTGWEGRGEDRGAGPRLYRNRFGDGPGAEPGFSDVTAEAGLGDPVYGMGAWAADYDGDGDQDLYVTAVGDNRLYRNDGGRFTDVTAVAGAKGNSPGAADPAWSTAAAWFDADRDGWLDLLVCNYVDWTPETDLFFSRDGVNKSYATPEEYEGESCRLLKNDGSGKFTDVTETAGLLNAEGKSLGIAVDDFNDDGWPDVAVANDTYPNFLYINQGDGTFADAGLDAGIAFDRSGRARAGMGIDVADITNRGQLSIAIGNFSNEAVSLYTAIGPLTFQDLAGTAGLTRPTLLPLTFGLRFADLSSDGNVDLVLGNGHIEPEIRRVQGDVDFEQAPILFQNDGRGKFMDVGSGVGGGFAEPIVARGVATSDLDRDGDLDLVFTANGGAPKVFRNDTAPPGAWVRVRLRGSAPNFHAIGSIVKVFAGGVARRFYVGVSGSYLSQSETNPVLAGLGDAVQADSISVRWPDGETTMTGPVAAGTQIEIQQPGGGR